MNAISRGIPARLASCGPADATAACAARVDGHIGASLELLGDTIGAIYGQRRALTPDEARLVVALRGCMVSLSHARDLIAPLMVERAS